MRYVVKNFVALVAKVLPIKEPIYEFGALQVEGQVGFADLRPIFPGKEYIGADMREGIGVDKVLNLHNIDLPDETAGTVLCVDTLEHVEYPRKALEEMHRILKPGSFACVISTMNFFIHGYPSDYWRFTPEGLRSLFKPYTYTFIGWAGIPSNPHTVVGVGFKGIKPDDELIKELEAQYKDWQSKSVNNA